MFDQQTVPYDHVDTEYQTFKMQDFERRADAPLLVQIEYLRSMFDIAVENERGKPIVITLTEKQDHFESRSGSNL